MTSTYSRENLTSLPTDDDDLTTAFASPGDYNAVALNDGTTVDQQGTEGYAAFEWKETATGNNGTFTWKGKSTKAPSESKVQMQIYKRTGTGAPVWEDVPDASDNSTAADTNFTISGTVSDLTNYKAAGTDEVALRVYQAASGVTYLLNDTFTTDRGAGAVNGTASEPGPGGNRTVNSTLASISSGSALLRASAGTTTQSWLYSAQDRALGQVLFAEITNVNVTNALLNYLYAGFFSTDLEAFQVLGLGPKLIINESTKSIDLGTGLTTGQSANIAIVQRAYGNFWFYKPPGGSNWLLVYVTDMSNQASLTPGYKFNVDDTSYYNQSAFIELVSSWYPLPVVSDSFGGSWGTTDGAGHYGANNSGEGVGGDSISWTTQTGAVGIVSGAAKAVTLTAGEADATVDATKSDAIITAKMSSANVNGSGIIIRFSDMSNFILAYPYNGSFLIDKKESNSWSNLATGSITYGDGKRIVIVTNGTSIRVYYDELLVCVATGVTFNQTATNYGMRFASIGPTVDDFTIYPLGSGGEYNTDLNNLLGE